MLFRKKPVPRHELLKIDGRMLEVRLRLNPRARRMIVKVNPTTGEVSVTAPSRRGLAHALDFARGEQDWIRGQLAKVPGPVLLGAGATIPFMGTAHEIRAAAKGPAPVWSDDGIIWVRGHEAHASRRVQDFLKKQAREVLEARVLEHALFSKGIPYRVYGGLRFFERAEIKHALAYLRLLENPADDTSFLRVVNFPPRGIGARSLEQVQDVARAAGGSLHDAVGAVSGKAGANMGAFTAKIQRLRQQTQGYSLREIVELVLDESGLIAHYKADREGADRIENLEELVNAAESFVTQEGFGRDAVALPVDELGFPPDAETGETLSPLAAFLTHAALESGDNQAQAGQDAIQLMTVHSSKGLEFDCVFITGMEEGLFPHENAMSDRDGLEEERRLMYVAITRARQRLYLSHSQTRMLHGQTRYNVRSRFFDELPESALKWITPKKTGFGTFPAGATSAHTAWARPVGAAGSGPARQTEPAIARKEVPGHGLRAGIKVFHAKFGEGTVLSLEGAGDDARAQINFPRHGLKWLALSVAKLTLLP